MKFVFWCFVILAGTLSSCMFAADLNKKFNFDERRYRLTFEMETPEGLKAGSSVIRVTRGHPLPFDPFQYYTWKLQGQAIFLDLGSGKNAIMLMTHGAKGGSGDSFYSLWANAHGERVRHDNNAWSGKRQLPGIIELQSELIPTIITFTDINDPASAKVIHATNYRQQCRDRTMQMPNCQPENIPVPIDEIAATLGAGYAFRRATVEIVPNDTPITTGIEGRLAWWNGPFPWLKPLSSGSSTFVDTRPSDQFRWGKEHFKRDF